MAIGAASPSTAQLNFMPSLSLVLATYGRSDLIGRFVASLEVQTSADFELIIVDQNNDDRVVPYVAQARNASIHVNHIRMAQPNLSAARNKGIAQATGAIVAFPDDDCWYEPDVIEQVLATFATRPHWNGLVADWVEAATPGNRASLDPFLSGPKWRQFRGGDASSIALFFRAEMLRNIGGFDERFGVGQWFGAGEETDLILAALASGAQLARCANIRVHHHFQAQDTKALAGNWRAALRRGRGTGALYVKHRMNLWVMLRGFLSPLINSVIKKHSIGSLLLSLAVSAGRIQGALLWALKFR